MRIAVIGTGISGLASAWLLDRAHEVHVFEREPRLGGHTHTIDVDPRSGAATSRRGDASRPGDHVAVDTGFIVYNEPTYPNLTRLFDELEVATQPSDMSWALRCEHHDLEYAGNLRGLVAQPRNLADPGYQRMVRDILRFNRIGRRLRSDPRAGDVTLGRFLHAAGLGDGFRDHYLLPMAAAIWSTGTGRVADFPLGTLLTFFDNHGLLGVTTHHPWRTVTGGTSSYLPKLTVGFRDRIHTGDAVTSVGREDGDVELRLASGTTARFDKVVIATHADDALGLLADPAPDEKELLGSWDYSTNDTWLHTDASLLPRSTAARASWNYLVDDCRAAAPGVSLSYSMNRLSSLDTATDYIVTLNPPRPPDPATVLRRMTYTHPVYTPDSTATQARLGELSGRRNTFYAGAYHRYGFHEDGLVSALDVAARFGVPLVSGGSSALYVGTLRHRRHRPRAHAFRYGVYHALLDLDEVDALDREVAGFGHNRRAVSSFWDRDHMGPEDLPVRTKLARWLAAQDVALPPGPVHLVTNLRVLGHVFNPVSWFLCHDRAGELALVVAEVRNTFGESYAYVLDDLRPAGGGVVRAEADKVFHVSPFMDIPDHRYRFTIRPPGERLAFHMDVLDGEGKLFDATLVERRRAFTARTLWTLLVRYPLAPLVGVIRIHRQALSLWRKRIPFHRKPEPPADRLRTVRDHPRLQERAS